MKILILLLGVCFIFQSCTDIFDQEEYKIVDDIYAMHYAGIDGFSMSKKTSAQGSTVIIEQCLVSASYNKELNFILANRVENFSSKDTIYLKYSLINSQLDTLTSMQFYNLKLEKGFTPDVILLKDADSDNDKD